MSDSSNDSKPQQETSPGGSVIHRYKTEDWQRTRMGPPEESAAAFGEAREAVYRRLFGEPITVSYEVLPLILNSEVRPPFASA